MQYFYSSTQGINIPPQTYNAINGNVFSWDKKWDKMISRLQARYLSGIVACDLKVHWGAEIQIFVNKLESLI